MTHFTDDEIKIINEQSGIDFTHAPIMIRGVSQSQISIARHYGGIDYGGKRYHYHPGTDELIRGDVLAWWAKRQRADAKKRGERGMANQVSLF